jgi:hypothetical protein
MSDGLFQLATRVVDEASFISFLEALRDNRQAEVEAERAAPSNPYGPGARGWENGSIGQFLDAAVAWGQATANGTAHYSVPQNPWQRAAQIICAGKLYE